MYSVEVCVCVCVLLVVAGRIKSLEDQLEESTKKVEELEVKI